MRQKIHFFILFWEDTLFQQPWIWSTKFELLLYYVIGKKTKAKQNQNKIQVLLYLNYTNNKQVPFSARLKKTPSIPWSYKLSTTIQWEAPSVNVLRRPHKLEALQWLTKLQQRCNLANTFNSGVIYLSSFLCELCLFLRTLIFVFHSGIQQ